MECPNCGRDTHPVTVHTVGKRGWEKKERCLFCHSLFPAEDDQLDPTRKATGEVLREG